MTQYKLYLNRFLFFLLFLKKILIFFQRIILFLKNEILFSLLKNKITLIVREILSFSSILNFPNFFSSILQTLNIIPSFVSISRIDPLIIYYYILTQWLKKEKERGEKIMAYIEILCGIIVSMLVFYYYFTSAFNFWKIRGIPGPKPKFLFGNIRDIILSRISTPTFIKNIYDTYTNEPMVGLYMGRNPILLLKDPELIKDVLIRDFSKFADRGFNVHEKVEV